MRSHAFLCAVLSLLPLAAAAQMPPASMHTALTGGQVAGGGDPDGEAFLALVVPGNGSPIGWSAHVRNVALPATIELRLRPTESSIGGDVVLAALPLSSATQSGTFMSVRDAFLASQPQRVCAVLTNGEHPGGALIGCMVSLGSPGVYTLPVIGRVAGQGGTAFVSDLRLSSLDHDWTEGNVTATVEWWPAGPAGSGPAASFVKTIPPGSMLVLNDVTRTELGLDQALGAMRVISSRPIHVTARIYNDQVAAGKGTFGQFSRGATSDLGKLRFGAIPHLHNVPISSGGLRTNIGWFNRSGAAIVLTLTAHRPDGTLLGVYGAFVNAGSVQPPTAIGSLIPATVESGDFYLLYQVDLADSSVVRPTDFYIYAAVTDNVNGDAIFVLGQPR